MYEIEIWRYWAALICFTSAGFLGGLAVGWSLCPREGKKRV